ncbi:Lipase [Psilocybe cubensis]|uniref:Lipase n=2 Tax=Psilocybe cubensis TaxID=181762 RepID=A0ACB8GVM0_PSICU|nr:Lipase [Psilocybe cubensis]KAH9479276.1 Lipase [Psilocybe cubensis]
MVYTAGITLALLFGLANAAALPVELEARATSVLSAATIASYKPYTYYASAAYCKPASTLAWNCGTNCAKNPTFKPIASGGNGAAIQYWYVGYDATLKTIIVAYQGTDGSKIIPIVTNADFFLDGLESSYFPGVSSSVKTHNGFGEAHKRSASAVLAAVRQGMATYATNKVTVVGHSLGGALAIIGSAHIAVNIPSANVKTVSYAAPRVGNAAFADYVNAKADMVRINNKKDIVPIVPGRFVGFAHTEGEIHITSSGTWLSCPGQDSTDAGCTIDAVPNILAGDVDDHSGPFDGVMIGC